MKTVHLPSYLKDKLDSFQTTLYTYFTGLPLSVTSFTPFHTLLISQEKLTFNDWHKRKQMNVNVDASQLKK